MANPATPDDAAARRLAHLEARKAHLEAQMAQVKARLASKARRELTAAKIVVGGAVLAHASTDPGFARALARLLRQKATRPADARRIQTTLASLDALAAREAPP